MTREMIDGLKRFGLFLADEFSGAQPGEWRAVIIGAEAATDAVEAIALLSAGTWREIETAPKDGTPMLLFSNDYGKHLMGYGRYRRFDDNSQGWIASSFHCYNGEVWTVMSRPTHWMPLPAPPSDGDQRPVKSAEGKDGQ